MSKPTQFQINIAKKTLAKKMQQFVEAVLKMIMIVLKLLNGYSVIPIMDVPYMYCSKIYNS